MERLAVRRLVVALALALFLCAAALAVADVVRISPPWTVKSDPDTFSKPAAPAEPLPPPVEEEPDLPDVDLAEKPKSCVGDARCVSPKERTARKRADRNEERESDRQRDEVEQVDQAREPREARDDRPAEFVAETLEDLGEDVLSEPELVLPEPLCHDPDACVALLLETFGCDSLESCQELYLGERDDAQSESDSESHETEGEPSPPLCEDEESCAALLVALFGCDSFDACEEHYLGAVVPDVAPEDPAADPEPEPVVEEDTAAVDTVLQLQP